MLQWFMVNLRSVQTHVLDHHHSPKFTVSYTKEDRFARTGAYITHELKLEVPGKQQRNVICQAA